MFTSVAKPIGTVPKKSDWTGWRSMSVHVAGYRVWRKIEIRRMRVIKESVEDEEYDAESTEGGRVGGVQGGEGM
jgi:hypothetical protein